MLITGFLVFGINANSLEAHDFEVDRIYYRINSEISKTVKVTYKDLINYRDSFNWNILIPETVTYDKKLIM